MARITKLIDRETKAIYIALTARNEEEFNTIVSQFDSKSFPQISVAGCPTDEENSYYDHVFFQPKSTGMTWADAEYEVKEAYEHMKAIVKAHNANKSFTATIEPINTVEAPQTTNTFANENTITLYHGTHDANVSFNNVRPIKNYNTIGTWFTSTTQAAEMYGPNIITRNVTINNPLYAHTDNFDEFFYCIPLATKYLGHSNKPTEKEMTSLLLNSTYMTEWKQMIVNAGYDAVVFVDSRIDLDSNDDFKHTVYIVFDTDNITQSEVQTLAPNLVLGQTITAKYGTGEGKMVTGKIYDMSKTTVWIENEEDNYPCKIETIIAGVT